MPLPVRYIEAQPRAHGLPLVEAVSQHKLRALSVQNIATVIRELGSLARHAEGVMGDIADLLGSYHARTCVLEERTRRLREEVLPSLDSEQEALEGFEIPHPSFHFRSRQSADQQQPLSHSNAPPALLEQILTATTPSIDLLTPLWADGRSAMDLYSKPAFFFEQWRGAIQRDALRRKSTHDLLSPNRVVSKKNGSARLPPKDGSKSSLKRSSSLKKSRSFRNRSKSASAKAHRHSSTQSLTDVGRVVSTTKHRPRVTSESLRRTYSVRVATRPGESSSSGGGGGLRHSLRRKAKDRPKLGTLGKTMAAAYSGSDINLSVRPSHEATPTAATATTAQGDKNGFKRGGFLRRSLTIRRSRSKSRSRSPAPVPTATEAAPSRQKQPVQSLESGESKYITLSHKHLENLDLGSAAFDTRVDLNSDKKQVSTFKFPGSALQTRSGSPLTLLPRSITPRRDFMAAPKVAPKPSRSQPNSQEYDPPFQRSATVGTVNPEMRSIVDNIRRKRSQAAQGRPASFAMEREYVPPHQPSLRQSSKLSTSAVSIPNPQGSQPKLSASTLSIPFFQPSLPTMASFKPIEPPSGPPMKAASSPQHSSPNSSSHHRRPPPAVPLVNASPPLAPAATLVNASPHLAPAAALVSASLPLAPAATLVNASPHLAPAAALVSASPPLAPAATLVNASPHLAPAAALVCASPPVVPPVSVAPALATPTNPSPTPRPPPPTRTDSLSFMQYRNQSSEVIKKVEPRTETPNDNSIVPRRNSSANAVFYLPPEFPPHITEPSPDRNRKESLATAIGNAITSMNTKRSSAMLPEDPFATSTTFATTNFCDSPRRKSSAFDPVTSSPAAATSRIIPRLVKQESLYISPRKNSVMVPTLGVLGEQPASVRMSQILKAGGVDENQVDDQRSGLLEAIRRGTQLKKVEQESQQHGELAWDVAAILERYVALHSDGEESEQESFSDQDDWLEALGT